MRLKSLILTVLLLLFGVSPAFAVAPTISNVPSTINTDSEFSISVSMSGLSINTIYRLRLALAVTGTSNYFGSTFNGSTYYNGTPSPINYANFLSVTTDSSGAWSGTLQGKVESSDPNFSGTSGTYDLKVGRYTASGTSATWSNISQTNVVVPTPSPSPSISSSSSPSSTTSSTSSFTISNIPSTIDSTETFNASVNLSLSDKANTTFYLKGAFKRKDNTNYFGQTKVSGSWIKNNKTYSDQYKIITSSSGNWSGNLEIMPDIMDSGYEGAGEYIFKVGRYSEDGSLNWSNETTVKINAQEIVLDDANSNVLGINEKKEATKTTKSKAEALSLEKYVKAATPQSRATPSANPKTEVKGAKQTNFLSIIGGILVIIGAVPITYAIYYKFRKRNKVTG